MTTDTETPGILVMASPDAAAARRAKVDNLLRLVWGLEREMLECEHRLHGCGESWVYFDTELETLPWEPTDPWGKEGLAKAYLAKEEAETWVKLQVTTAALALARRHLAEARAALKKEKP